MKVLEQKLYDNKSNKKLFLKIISIICHSFSLKERRPLTVRKRTIITYLVLIEIFNIKNFHASNPLCFSFFEVCAVFIDIMRVINRCNYD